MSAPARALAIALIALAGLLAGFLAYRVATPNAALRASSADATHAATAQPSAAEALDAAAAAAKPLPSMLPDVRLPNLANQSVGLHDFLGQPLIINFWATWCAPCRREMPLLQQLRHDFKADRLQIVGVAVDFEAAVRDYLKSHAVDYPVLIGESQGLGAIEQFGLEPVLPVSVFADAQGRIIAAKIGELHRAEADFILGQMRAIAAGRVSLEAGRAAIAAQLKALAIERAKAGDQSS